MRHRRLAAASPAPSSLALPAGGARRPANPYLNEQASATPGADQGSNANYRSLRHAT